MMRRGNVKGVEEIMSFAVAHTVPSHIIPRRYRDPENPDRYRMTKRGNVKNDKEIASFAVTLTVPNHII
jgi:hypothetical protein